MFTIKVPWNVVDESGEANVFSDKDPLRRILEWLVWFALQDAFVFKLSGLC